MSLAGREETDAAELECRTGSILPSVSSGREFTRNKLQSFVRSILLDDAFRDSEWVMYEGRPISNIELLIRELMEHKAWQAKVAAIELGFGRAPVVNQVEGGVEVVFKVEHDDSWIEAVTEEEEAVEGEFKVGT